MNELSNLLTQYETCGFDTDEQLISFFQELINSGLCWHLQGHYGRTARALINVGHCTAPEAK